MSDNEEGSLSGGEAPEVNKDDLRDTNIVTKYRQAADIANGALKLVISKCVDGARIVELCQAGDDFIVAEAAKLYKKKKSVTKGIGFPTCISVNHIVSHYSPLAEDEKTMKTGDLVKIDLGCHIDGYIAVAAHTVLVGGGKITGRMADVFMAAHTASEAVVRKLKAGAKNHEVTDVIQQSVKAFECEAVQGVLSHQMNHFVIDGEKVIIGKPDPDQKVEEVEFEPNEVYAIDIVVSTGEGKPKESTERTCVYKRNVESNYQLKMKASRFVLSEINKSFPTFPFSIRALDPKKVRFGIVECHNHGLVLPYPVLVEKEGEHVAHFKFTCLLLQNGTVKISGLPIDLANIESDKKVTDPELLKLLATSVGKKKKKNKKKKKKKAAAAKE